MALFSLLSYVFVETLGLAIACVAAVVLLYMVLRRLHSLRMTLALCALFVGVIIFFFVPSALPRGFGYSSFVTTYGPADDPGLPFMNAVRFFLNFDKFEKVAEIARDPNDVSVPITRTATTTVNIDVTVKEVIAEIAPGVYQNFWTFDNKVPGPFMRVMEGDKVIVTLHNDISSIHHHTIDFHSVIGPGGGASILSAKPGETKTLTFVALHPGLYIYHCAHPNVAVHMAHGQYGLMLVEPKGGLPKVDKEFYVVQGEFYTTGSLGKKGLQIFDAAALLDGKPQYIVFNGRTGALAGTSTMQANVGQTIRIYFGNGGVNLISSFHVIGEIFDRVYEEGSLTSPPLTDVQTTLVPAGGATVVDFKLREPGNYVLVDHALARMDRGAWGVLHVNGPSDPSIFSGEMQAMVGH